MQGPIIFAPADMYLLVPELRQQQSASRVNEATSVGGRLVIAAHRPVERAGGRAAEGIVRRDTGEVGLASMACFVREVRGGFEGGAGLGWVE